MPATLLGEDLYHYFILDKIKHLALFNGFQEQSICLENSKGALFF